MDLLDAHVNKLDSMLHGFVMASKEHFPTSSAEEVLESFIRSMSQRHKELGTTIFERALARTLWREIEEARPVLEKVREHVIHTMVVSVFQSVRQRLEDEASRVIQMCFLRAYYDPSRNLCKKRLRRECLEMRVTHQLEFAKRQNPRL
jgi:hypothetical protein